MPPPQNMNTLKRKTLAERAGEPTGRPAPAPPTSRALNAHVRATSITGVPQDSSLSSSVSSRQTSRASTRNNSNSSYSSSVGTRPPSSQSYRPQSAMAAHSRIQRPVFNTRPATSLEVHEEESEMARMAAKKKGRTPLSSCPNPPEYSSLRPPKLRGFSIRDFSMGSLNTKFNTLSLDSGHTQSAPAADVEVPATPSHIPKLVPQVPLHAETPSRCQSPRKTPRTLPLPKFLNRGSNEVIAAWEYDSRLDEVESMCSLFKEQFDGATTESKSLKEVIGVYKIRSESCSACSFTSGSNKSSYGVGIHQSFINHQQYRSSDRSRCYQSSSCGDYRGLG